MKKAASAQHSSAIDPRWKIAIVAARFYEKETDALIESARKALLAAGIPAKNISLHEAPGSFEIPLIGAVLAESQAVDALIGIGIIIEGKTHHARLLAEATTQGIMETQLTYHIPFAFEVLYVDSLKLARARSHKGAEAAHAVLRTLATLKATKKT